MGWFDAFNYSMTSTATGGFSPESGSITTFHSPAEDVCLCIILFPIWCQLHIAICLGSRIDIKKLIKNSEFRFYTTMVLSFAIFIAFELVYRNHYDIEHAFRSALFQVVPL